MINTVIRYLDAISDNVKAYKHWFIYDYICWDKEEFKEDVKAVYSKIENAGYKIKWCVRIIIQALIGFISMFVIWELLWCLFRG